MRFAVLGPTYPFRGGIAHYTTLLVKHLRERHTVNFYSYWRQYPQRFFPGNTASDPSLERLEESCERTLDALNPFTWWTTAHLIVAGKPDVLLVKRTLLEFGNGKFADALRLQPERSAQEGSIYPALSS